MEVKRTTQQDIADRLGLHRGTVSLALRHSLRIPEATRKRVVKMAEKMGYVPDPMLSSLAAYRNRCRKTDYRGTLAYIVNSRYGPSVLKSPHYKGYFSGAQRRAQEYGYELEVFDICAKGMTTERLDKILETRSIRGLLLCPRHMVTPDAEEFRLRWDRYSAITFGYSFAALGLHTVAEAHFRNVRWVARQLRLRRYRRIGLMMSAYTDHRMDVSFLGGFLSDFYWETGTSPVPPLGSSIDEPGYSPQALAEWIDKNRIDAIVSSRWDSVAEVESLGLRVPEDVALVCANIPEPDGRLAGMNSNSLTVGATAIDFLVPMIQRGERGIPVHRLNLLVDGTWCEGSSIRQGKSESEVNSSSPATRAFAVTTNE